MKSKSRCQLFQQLTLVLRFNRIVSLLIATFGSYLTLEKRGKAEEFALTSVFRKADEPCA